MGQSCRLIHDNKAICILLLSLRLGYISYIYRYRHTGLSASPRLDGLGEQTFSLYILHRTQAPMRLIRFAFSRPCSVKRRFCFDPLSFVAGCTVLLGPAIEA